MVNAKKTKLKLKRVRVKKSSTKMIKTEVKKQIALKLENKNVQYFSTGTFIYPSVNANWTSSHIPLSPYGSYLSLNQGVGNGTRVGNEIIIKKLIFQGNLYQLPYNATSNPTPFPCHVKFWIMYDKTNPDAVPNPQSDFLQNGNSTTPLFNDLVDLWAPVNAEKYRVLATKEFKIGYAGNTGSGLVAGQAYGANNDYKFNQKFKFDLTKHVVKRVKYNDNNASPTTRGLYLVATVVQANGSQYSNVTIPVEMQYVLNMEYEDA